MSPFPARYVVKPKVAHGFNFWPGVEDDAPAWVCLIGAKTVMLSARWYDGDADDGDNTGFGWLWSVAVLGAGGEPKSFHVVENTDVPISLPECLWALVWWGTIAENRGADTVIQLAAQAQHARRP